MIDNDQPIQEPESVGKGRFTHVIVYVNLGFALGLAFAAGAEHERISHLETVQSEQVRRIAEVQRDAVSTAELSGQMSMLREEMTRVRDRLDRFLDTGK